MDSRLYLNFRGASKISVHHLLEMKFILKLDKSIKSVGIDKLFRIPIKYLYYHERINKETKFKKKLEGIMSLHKNDANTIPAKVELVDLCYYYKNLQSVATIKKD